MVYLRSWKIYQHFFEPRTPSASMLTCRGYTVDTTQTLTQTNPLTLNEQEARRGVFPGRNGIIIIFLEQAEILPLFCVFRNWYFYRCGFL